MSILLNKNSFGFSMSFSINFFSSTEIVCDATFQIVPKCSIHYLHMKIIIIHCIVFCVHSVKRICPVHICLIYTCRRNMIPSLLYNPSENQWYVRFIVHILSIHSSCYNETVRFNFSTVVIWRSVH